MTGFSNTDIADRVVHDGWHVAQLQDGKTVGLKDYRTDPVSQQRQIGLEQEAIQVEIKAVQAIQKLPEGQGAGVANNLTFLKTFVDPSDPNYQKAISLLVDRIKQPT